MDLLDGLGENVRRRVTEDIEAVLLGRRHRFDDVTVGDDMVEVTQLAAHPGDQHRAVSREEVAGGRALLHGALVSSDVDGDGGRHAGSPGWDGTGEVSMLSAVGPEVLGGFAGHRPSRPGPSSRLPSC